MQKVPFYGAAFFLILGSLVACMGTTGTSMSNGGELTGVSAGPVWNEPAPYGMVLVK